MLCWNDIRKMYFRNWDVKMYCGVVILGLKLKDDEVIVVIVLDNVRVLFIVILENEM